MTTTCGCHSLHWSVDFSMKEEKKLGNVLKMEKVEIRGISVLSRPKYERHAGAGWAKKQMLCHQKYLILLVCNLKDVVTILNGCSIGSQEGPAGGSTTGKNDVLNKEVKKDAHLVDWESEQDNSSRSADDQSFADR